MKIVNIPIHENIPFFWQTPKPPFFYDHFGLGNICISRQNSTHRRRPRRCSHRANMKHICSIYMRSICCIYTTPLNRHLYDVLRHPLELVPRDLISIVVNLQHDRISFDQLVINVNMYGYLMYHNLERENTTGES